MPQEGAPRLLHERIAAGRAAVIARLAQHCPDSNLPDPELSAHMLSAYADEAARLVLEDYAVERILELTAGRSRAGRVILADFSLLRRRRELRLLVFGYAVSLFGTMFTQVALAVQVYDLTGRRWRSACWAPPSSCRSWCWRWSAARWRTPSTAAS